MNVDEFRECAKQDAEVVLRAIVRVTATDLWVGLLQLPPGDVRPIRLWDRRYERPPGKTQKECVEAGARMALQAIQNGSAVLH